MDGPPTGNLVRIAAAPPSGAPHPDLDLAREVLRKDRKATAEFVDRYTGPVLAYIRSRLQPRTEQVEDLVQDVFTAAWQYLPGYRGTSPLGAWILGIARHKVEDYYRSRIAEAESLDGADVADDGPPPDLILDRARASQRAQQVLGGIPEHYAAVLRWRYWDGRSSREIAQSCGRTEKAVERLLARARDDSEGGGRMADELDQLWRQFAEATGDPEDPQAPARLRSKIFSRLMEEQAREGPLASVSESKAAGRDLCVFEEIMRLAPVGEEIRKLNYCRVCHARVLAENMDNAPIWWEGCPYAQFHRAALKST